jgi:hypothetical protein
MTMLAGVLSMVGCSAVSPDRETAAAAAATFQSAVASGHGQQACNLLVPGTASALEYSDGKPCAKAIESVGLPASGLTKSSQAYGLNAVVQTATDVLFLFDDNHVWKVVAAGCRPTEPGEPYQCLLQGG